MILGYKNFTFKKGLPKNYALDTSESLVIGVLNVLNNLLSKLRERCFIMKVQISTIFETCQSKFCMQYLTNKKNDQLFKTIGNIAKSVFNADQKPLNINIFYANFENPAALQMLQNKI